MKRKFNQGGLAEATGAAIRNRIAEMAGKQAPESVMMPGIRGLYKPSGRTGPVNPMTVELNPDDSPIMTRGKQPPLPANFVEEAVPKMRPPEIPRITPRQREELLAMRSSQENAMRALVEGSQAPMGIRKTIPRQVRRPDVTPAFAKGGSVKSKGIDGCAQRGKTRGRYL